MPIGKMRMLRKRLDRSIRVGHVADIERAMHAALQHAKPRLVIERFGDLGNGREILGFTERIAEARAQELPRAQRFEAAGRIGTQLQGGLEQRRGLVVRVGAHREIGRGPVPSSRFRFRTRCLVVARDIDRARAGANRILLENAGDQPVPAPAETSNGNRGGLVDAQIQYLDDRRRGDVRGGGNFRDGGCADAVESAGAGAGVSRRECVRRWRCGSGGA